MHVSEINVKKRQTTDEKYQTYIEWLAIEGSTYWDMELSSIVKKPTLSYMARLLGVSRQTLYNWSKSVQSEHIEKERRNWQLRNVNTIWNTLFMKACSGDTRAIEMYLANFDPYYIAPKQRSHTPMPSGLAELINQIRKKRPNNS